MNPSVGSYVQAVRRSVPVRRIGHVTRLGGLAIEVQGLHAAVGEICAIGSRHGGKRVLAEVVGVRDGDLALLPYGIAAGLAAGCEVVVEGSQGDVPAGDAMLGRVIDAFAQPLVGRGPIPTSGRGARRSAPVNPMQRPRISKTLETGIRSIDALPAKVRMRWPWPSAGGASMLRRRESSDFEMRGRSMG